MMLRRIQAIYQFCSQPGMRLLLALAVFAFSCWWMAEPVLSGNVIHATPYVLVGIPMIGISAIVAAPQIARALADSVFEFFSFSEKFDRPQPMYGVPMALRKSGKYEAAMSAYEDVAADYPGEIKPYLEMIDMALSDLKDPARADSVYQRAVLLFEDEEDRKKLARFLSGLRLGD